MPDFCSGQFLSLPYPLSMLLCFYLHKDIKNFKKQEKNFHKARLSISKKSNFILKVNKEGHDRKRRKIFMKLFLCKMLFVLFFIFLTANAPGSLPIPNLEGDAEWICGSCKHWTKKRLAKL